jgi:hypothetical protein
MSKKSPERRYCLAVFGLNPKPNAAVSTTSSLTSTTTTTATANSRQWTTVRSATPSQATSATCVRPYGDLNFHPSPQPATRFFTERHRCQCRPALAKATWRDVFLVLMARVFTKPASYYRQERYTYDVDVAWLDFQHLNPMTGTSFLPSRSRDLAPIFPFALRLISHSNPDRLIQPGKLPTSRPQTIASASRPTRL